MAVDVSIVPCKSYDAEECRTALTQVLAPFGGLDWVKEGMHIVIKVNLVSAMKPEQAATTHPMLLCELTKMLRERGASVLLGDSPGGLYTAAHLNHVYDVSGMHDCEAAGAELNQDFSQSDASFPEAVCAKKFTYTAYLDRADAIIDFCKLKTHGMMGMTSAVKNYFGVIPGTMKPEYHYKYPQISDFSNMLIDLSTYFKPRLCICDAIVGMEGNGPTQGLAARDRRDSGRRVSLEARPSRCQAHWPHGRRRPDPASRARARTDPADSGGTGDCGRTRTVYRSGF